MADMIYCTGGDCFMSRHCARNTRVPEDKTGHTGLEDPARYEVFITPPFILTADDEKGCNYFWPEAFGDLIRQEVPTDMTVRMGPPIPIHILPEETTQIPVVPGGEITGGATLGEIIGTVEPPPSIKGVVEPVIPSEVGLPTLTQPEFTIRAQDRGGPETVLDWVKRAGAHGATPAKLRGAFEVYLDMIKWQQKNKAWVKTPD